MDMGSATFTVDGCRVVSVSGEIDVASAPVLTEKLQAQLTNLTPPTGRLIVDLSEVDFMDSSGISVLLRAMHLTDTAGGNLVLVHNQPRLTKLLHLTGLDHVFTVYPTLTAATTTG